MTPAWSIAIAAAAGVLAIARPAAAHPLDLAYLRVDVADRDVTVTLDLEAGFAARVAVAMDPVRAAAIDSDAGTCAWSDAPATTTTRGATTTIVDHARCPAAIRGLRWPLPVIARGATTFRVLAKVGGLGDQQGERVAIVDRGAPVLDVRASAGAGVRFTELVRTGVAHIGALPSEWRGPHGWKLPDGIDHILFVLALLLGGGRVRDLARITTGFTIGHSITLALSALGVARPPAGVIEPLIALSIAIVAAEAMASRPGRHRWKVATLFGLVHGFGFAGALHPLDLGARDTIVALFGYNLGVELGQLVIILAAAPLVLLAHRDARTRVLVARVAPALILVAGVYWTIARAVCA